MKHGSPIEPQLIAAGDGKGANEAFVLQTMEKLKAASASAVFDKALKPQKHVSLWQRFLRLPKYAMLAIILGVCALVSGTAYAAYSLWLSPSAQVQSVENKYGRDQALISLKNCSGSGDKVTVEITKGSKGTPEGAAASELARCETQAVQAWAIQSLHGEPSNVLFPFSNLGWTKDSITVQFNGPADDRPVTYHITADTPIIFQGKPIALSKLSKADTLAIVTADNHTARAVVKLSLPAKYYMSDEVNNDYHDRQPCYGNPAASCINLPSLDVNRDGEGGANPDYQGAEGREIQGKLLSYTVSQFVLQATDGTQYTVHTASDVIGTFNQSNPYGATDNITIEPGDVLMIMYTQAKGDDPKVIQSNQYHMIQLLLQGFSKRATTAKNNRKYHY